jgi:hypothetical protein
MKIPLPDSLPTSPTAPAALPFFGPQPRPEAELIDAENTSWLPPHHPVGQSTFSRTFPRPRPTKRRSTVSYPVRDFAEILEGENRSYMPERHAVDTDTAQDRERRRSNRESIYNRAMAHIHIPHLSHLSSLSNLSNLSPRSPTSPSQNQNLEDSPTSPLPSSSRRHSRIQKLHLQVPYLFGGPGGLSRTPTHTPVTPFISVTEERQVDPVEAFTSSNPEIRGAYGNDAELLEDENTAWAGPTPPPLSAISAISPVINTLTSLAIPNRRARRVTISHAPIQGLSTVGERL